MSLAGIDDNWIQDTLIGLGIGGFIFFLLKFVPAMSMFLGIGLPSIPLAVGTTSKYLIIVVSAAIFETTVFQDILLDLFDEKLYDLPFIVANIGQAIAFALYHFVAYGSSLSAAGGSLLSAGIFGFMMGYIRKGTNSILPVIIIHGILNFTILSSLFIVGSLI